jgi:Tol biopolymer transport system component
MLVIRRVSTALLTLVLAVCTDQSRTPTGRAGARPSLSAVPAATARRIWTDANLDPSVSPAADGRTVAFADWATGDVAVHDLAAGGTRRVTAKPNGWGGSSDFAEVTQASPDGSLIAYSWLDAAASTYQLRIIGVNGGDARTIASDARYRWLHPLAWTPDGRQVAFERSLPDGQFELAVADVAAGSVRILTTTPARWAGYKHAQFSPDGRVLFTGVVQDEAGPDRLDIVAIDIASGDRWPVVTAPADDRLVGVTPDGNALLFTSDRDGTTALYALPLADARPGGAPFLVRADMWNALGAGISTDGRLFYMVESGVRSVYAATIDAATGTVVEAASVLAEIPARGIGQAAVDWSPDGASTIQNFAFDDAPHPRAILTIRSTVTGETRELRPNLASIFNLSVSPDGARVLVNGVDRANRGGVFAVDLTTGAVTTVALVDTERRIMVRGAGWSPDGRTAFYTAEDFGRHALSLLSLELTSGTRRARGEIACDANCFARVSPDGRSFVAAPQTVGGTPETRILIVPVDGGTPRDLMRLTPPDAIVGAPAWAPDGQSLLLARGRDGTPDTTRLWLVPLTGVPREIDAVIPAPIASVRFHPDGRRFLAVGGETRYELWVLENFLRRSEP